MIVDFVSIKEKLHQGINLFLRAEVKKRSPFLSLVGSHLMHEGDEHSYETVDKQEKRMEFQKAETRFSLTRDEMSKITFPEILKKMEDSAEDMARQMEGGAFQTIAQEIDKVGNTIPGNPAYSPEALLQGLEMIDIDFDDARDKPRMPTVFIHPSQWEKFKEQDAKMTEEQHKELERKQQAILDKKYEEYVAREGKRKLVD
jgi:hypothetical protein